MNRRIAWLVGFGAAVAVATACAALEPSATGVCGNGVIEDAEDCDEPEGVAARAGGACVRAGELNACHYTCDTSAACPATWGCDLNEGICRRAGGTFIRKVRLETGAVRLAKGDFDGDGRADLLLSQPSDFDGVSTVTGYFFGEGMRERARVRIPTPIGPPHVFAAALSDKALGLEAQARSFPLSDVGFATTEGIGLLRGSEEEPFLPELLPFAKLPLGGFVIPIPSAPDPATGSSRGRITYGVAVAVGGRVGVTSFRLDGEQGGQRPLGELDGDVAQLASVTAPAGRALCLPTRAWGAAQATTSCSNALVYFRGAQKGVVYILDAESAETIPRRRPRIVTDAVVDAVAVGDIDGDGVSDIVIGQQRVDPMKKEPQPACPVVVYGSALGAPTPSGLDTFELRPVAMPTSACADPLEKFVGLADLNGDGVADFVYGTRVLFSRRAGASLTWATAYERPSAWAQMEVGDFDGDGRDDAVLAAVGQADLTVLRGGTGEVRPISVPTPEPVDAIVGGYFDGDRMLDVAYSTRADGTRVSPKPGGHASAGDAGAASTASVYVLFGGAEHETVRVGRKTAPLVNLRRPFAQPSQPDIDVLGLIERDKPTEATLYAIYAPRGRGLVSLAGLSVSPTPGQAIGGRGVALADLYGTGRLDAVRLKVPRSPGTKTECAFQAAVEVQPDILTPGRILDPVNDSDAPYSPLAPLAVAAARVGSTPMVFAVGAGGSRLRILRGVAPPATNGWLSQKLSLTDLTPPLAYNAGVCADLERDARSPAETLALLDVDGDGHDDLVFSDGGRVSLAGDPPSAYSLYPGVMVVLRGDGAGGFTRVSPEGMRGRSFAKARLPDGRPALAVLEAEKVVFYTLVNGALARVAGADARLEDPNGRALEIGDFDGDGLDDLAVLGGGVLKIYAGERKTAKDGG